jgi:hypothetical protein
VGIASVMVAGEDYERQLAALAREYPFVTPCDEEDCDEEECETHATPGMFSVSIRDEFDDFFILKDGDTSYQARKGEIHWEAMRDRAFMRAVAAYREGRYAPDWTLDLHRWEWESRRCLGIPHGGFMTMAEYASLKAVEAGMTWGYVHNGVWSGGMIHELCELQRQQVKEFRAWLDHFSDATLLTVATIWL